MDAKRKKIGLALGGGGARGFAHIGILKVLEEADITVDMIAGTSMGAIVGAFYCSGMKPRLIERLSSFIQRNHWMDLTFPRLGLVSGDKLEQFMMVLTKSANFSDLKKPLAVVATNLCNGDRVVIKEGQVARAVRASAAIPGVFCPVEYEGMTLVDGVVVERVPVLAARELGADIVIAVDLGIYLDTKFNHIFDVVLQCMDIMSRDLSRMITDKADLVLNPQLQHVSPGQFHKSEEAIKAGEDAARCMLPQIKELLNYKENCGEDSATNP